MFNLDEQAALGLTQAHLCDYHGRLVELSIVRDLKQMQAAASKCNITLSIASSSVSYTHRRLPTIAKV